MSFKVIIGSKPVKYLLTYNHEGFFFLSFVSFVFSFSFFGRRERKNIKEREVPDRWLNISFWEAKQPNHNHGNKNSLSKENILLSRFSVFCGTLLKICSI